MSGVLNFRRRGQAACSWPSHECWTLFCFQLLLCSATSLSPFDPRSVMFVECHAPSQSHRFRKTIPWVVGKQAHPITAWAHLGKVRQPVKWLLILSEWLMAETPDPELICLEVGESWIKGDITTLVLIAPKAPACVPELSCSNSFGEGTDILRSSTGNYKIQKAIYLSPNSQWYYLMT